MEKQKITVELTENQIQMLGGEDAVRQIISEHLEEKLIEATTAGHI